jgi:TonB-linked SusC/RagA family outer membrane protein
MRKWYCFLAVLLFHSSFVFAQIRQVNGKVLDAKDKSPLSGVTITAKGSKNAGITGPDGSFSLRVNAKATTLHFSYIGFEDQDVPIGAGDEPLVISLTGSQKAMNEVVVVGYGKAQKRDITGSITRIDAKTLENYPAPSFESAIQGKAAGVVVQSGSGKLGQAIQVNIRGTSSITASSQPLYVIDGLPVTTSSMSDPLNDDTNPLADINPNDIESLEILKDASASAIYGARAANGVVLITTKKGKNGKKTILSLDATTSVSNPARHWHFMNSKQYVNLFQQAAMNDARYDMDNNITNGIAASNPGQAAIPGGFANIDSAYNWYNENIYAYTLDQLALGTDWQHQAVNTDWQKLGYHHNAPSHQVNLSASGGSDKTRFFISGFYNDQDAIVINNTFSRYGARFNIDHNATDKLVFGLNLAIDRSQLDKVTNDNSFSTPGQIVAEAPIAPEFLPGTKTPNPNPLYASPIYDALYDFDHQITFRTLGNAYANYTILPSLSFRSEIGADILNLTENQFKGKESQDGAGIGKVSTQTSQSTTLNTNNYFTFSPHINDNNKLNAVMGMSYLQNDLFQSITQAQGFPSDAVKNLLGATNVTFGQSLDARYTFLSYFLRGNYTFKDRYLLSASIRTDGSSRFAPSHRYGWFPALSAGWLISEEDFMKNSFLSTLKLRASYGLTGNSEIGESRYQSLYSVTNYPNLPGYTLQQLASPNLHWEKTAQADVGIDFGLLKNRITGEVDYYHKHTTDLLLGVSVPYTTGNYVFNTSTGTGTSIIYQNLGQMTNEGFEVAISSQNLVGAFKWTTALSLGYNKNRVGNIGALPVYSGSGLERAIDGQPIGNFYMQKFLGVDPNNGDALYADANGKPTNDYNSAPLYSLGKYTPDYTAGLTNTFSYKGFDLSAFFYFVTGNKIYNVAGLYMSDGLANGNFDNQTVDIANAWTHPGQKTNVPRVGIGVSPDQVAFATGGGNSSRWLYDGRYLRLKNLTFGYTLPGSVSSAMKISSARLYVSGTNLFTWTKYPGDPEVSTNPVGTVGGGEDFYTIPQAKTFTLGLSVKF